MTSGTFVLQIIYWEYRRVWGKVVRGVREGPMTEHKVSSLETRYIIHIIYNIIIFIK